MNNVSFYELSKKEVISSECCQRLGYIIDLNINLETASVISIVVERPAAFPCFWKRQTVTIPYPCIKKIGEDLIIVEYTCQPEIKHEGKGGFLSGLFKN